MKNLFKVICFAIVLMPTALYANQAEKNVFEINKVARKQMLTEYKENLIKLENSVMHFEETLKRKELSMDLVMVLWMYLAQDYQRYGLSFTENDAFRIPTKEEFIIKKIDTSYMHKSINNQLKLIENKIK